MDFYNPLYQEDLKKTSSFIGEFSQEVSILITGATGLIGSFIIDTLIYYNRIHGRKIKIFGLSRSLEALKKRFGYSHDGDELELISHDLCRPLELKYKFDFIIHAASNSDPRSFALYPVETIQANVTGTINLLEHAKNSGKTRVLLTSTREVYGEIVESESYSETEFGLIDFNQIRSGYPESKRVAELMCRSYKLQYGIDTVIARLCYIYGPTMMSDDSKAIAQFIRKAINTENIVLKSPGEQRRSYCYIADAVAGLLCILFNGESGEAYNIANKRSTVTIKEIAELIAKYVQKRVVYEFPDDIEKKGYSNSQNAIISELKLAQLGWTPVYTMEEGLKRTIEILRSMNIQL